MILVRSKKREVRSGLVLGSLTLSKTSYVLLLTSYLLLASVPVNAADATTLTDVQSAFLQKDYPKTKQLAQALVLKTANADEKTEALYYQGMSDLWLGQYLPARQSFEQVLAAKPNKSMVDKTTLALVDTYYMEGDYKESLKRVEDLLEHSSRSEFLSSIYLKLARSHLKLAHWKKGREYLQKIIDKFPNSVERYHVEQLLQESQFFAVQLGSFHDRVKAESLVSDLQKKGEYAYIIETSSSEGEKFYRVRVGKFEQFDEAQSLETKLSRLGYPTKIYP